MGLFDSVLVPCPKCGRLSTFQSKSGNCYLKEYSFDDVPIDVLLDINRHSPCKCIRCGTFYEVDFEIETTSSSVLLKKKEVVTVVPEESRNKRYEKSRAKN